MNKKELMEQFVELTRNSNVDNSCTILKMYIDLIFKLIENNSAIQDTQVDEDAKMVNQMMFTKLLHIRKFIEGISYEGEGVKLNPIIDPTVLASLIRNLVETVLIFDLIYRETTSQEEKNIIYNMWVSSGLSYRQKFESVANTLENIEKCQQEKQEIEDIKRQIMGTSLYQGLTRRNKDKIINALNRKEFRVVFGKNNLKIVQGWQDVCDKIGCKKNIVEELYNYLSLYSHPSQVSVFQFREMFGKETREFESITNFVLKYCFFFTSIFISDYIKLFPSLQSTFDEIDPLSQMIINFYAHVVAGDKYIINKILDEFK